MLVLHPKIRNLKKRTGEDKRIEKREIKEQPKSHPLKKVTRNQKLKIVGKTVVKLP